MKELENKINHNKQVCTDILKARDYYRKAEEQYNSMSVDELRTAYLNPKAKQWEKELIAFIGKQKTGKI